MGQILCKAMWGNKEDTNKLKVRELELNLFIILLFQMDTAPYSPGVEATKARLGLLSKEDGFREHSYETLDCLFKKPT